jgi:single-strand DNA-binding protein
MELTISGYLGAEPEMKFTQSGKAFAFFSIAFSAREKADGKWDFTPALWFRIKCWERLAEAVCEAGLQRGDLLTVTGALSTREYGGHVEPVVTASSVALNIKPNRASSHELHPVYPEL